MGHINYQNKHEYSRLNEVLKNTKSNLLNKETIDAPTDEAAICCNGCKSGTGLVDMTTMFL